MTGQAPPAIRRPNTQRIHPPAPSRDIAAALNDALEHIANAERSLELAIAAAAGDKARLRTRRRGLRKERDRVLLWMVRHEVPLRAGADRRQARAV